MERDKKVLNGLEFYKVDVCVEGRNKENIFQQYSKKCLSETLKKPKYAKFKSLFGNEDEALMDLPLGESLFQLKKRGDDRYKCFLNINGDKKFCRFTIKEDSLTTKKGLYCYYENGNLAYIGRSRKPFLSRVNDGYGKIQPKNCYIDGQSTNCHLNALINESENIEFYVHPINDDLEIKETERRLINTYKEDLLWNVQKNHY